MLIRMYRSAHSLQVMVDRLVEELLQAQNHGLKTVDYSLPENDPDRIFMLKLILLMTVGDYPAQAKLSNFLHCGSRPCHWCNMDFKWYLPGHNINFNHRTLLPPEHWMREHVDLGPRELTDNRRCLRTHVEILQQMERCDTCELPRTSKDHPSKASGIIGYCSLSRLQLFDMKEDVLPDVMHMDAGIMKLRIMQLMKGDFNPKRPPSYGNTYMVQGTEYMYTPEQMLLRERKNKDITKKFADTTKVPCILLCTSCILLCTSCILLCTSCILLCPSCIL